MCIFRRRVFLICPVRAATDEQKFRLASYIEKLEKSGKKVYYPARDTDQNDSKGFRICTDNVRAIRRAHEVHIFFDPQSQGTLFDLGAAFALRKKLVIANPDDVVLTEGKSFANMITVWSNVK